MRRDEDEHPFGPRYKHRHNHLPKDKFIMPAIPTGKVLVTGANGFIAAWAVKAFLDAGFAVRGTVRSASKAKHLTNIFRSYGDKFELAIVDDITKVRGRALNARVAR